MESKQVIIIEDDQEICQLLEIHLKDLGCQVRSFMHGTRGFEAVLADPPDLVILDVMLPGMDGLDICQQLRAQKVMTPIIMLTARSEEIDRVLGLEIGADDYLTKPFSVREFLARVKAIFRRSRMIQDQLQEPQSQNALTVGQLSIDIDKRKVLMADRRIDLSPKEFELLVLMASNPGKSYKRSRLLNLIWGYDFEGYEHTVNSHINRLRAKIEPDMGQPTYILTTWGVGYRFNEDLERS
ncbi:response regulator transcription factor [Pontibacter sp. G13]|uniref:response regulator transcription factor n=1 Tax=Pontibacter sp. G13 TaxID=3074898 RepID=UPI002889D2AF|nr:response regulator transcription factor [Pontibacter sp. G13]WNJ17526.1 response regulator transcription factor [Pontibacter sp. G13]